MIAKLKFWAQRFLCIFGVHNWLSVRGSRKKTGYAIAHIIFPIHEMQEDQVCECCRLHRTRFGLVPPMMHHFKEEYPFAKSNGWPLDENGNQLPSYVSAGLSNTYQWNPKPKYHGKAGPEVEGYRPLFE